LSLCVFLIFVQGPHWRIPKVLSVHYFGDIRSEEELIL